MKKVILISSTLFLTTISFCQSKLNLSGQTFEKEKKNGTSSVKIEFKSNNVANYIMSGTLYNGSAFRDVCPCSYSITGPTIKIKCICSDKEIYPDPIEHRFNYNNNTKNLEDQDYENIWRKY